jgi:ATP-binding cassette subfamily F protein 3
LEQLDGEATLYDTVAARSASSDRTYIRNALGAFLFGGAAVDKQVKMLSGGEKSRLALAAILASPGNVLLLDEPTNHLDIASIEMLSESMASYAGTILFVSHDEYFISRLATRIIEVRPMRLRDFPGNLADYRYYVDKLFREHDDAATNKNGKPTRQSNTVDEKETRIREREERKKRERETSKLEQEIARKEALIAEHESILNAPENVLKYELLHTASTAIGILKKESEELTDRWIELSSL